MPNVLQELLAPSVVLFVRGALVFKLETFFISGDDQLLKVSLGDVT
jgi:hypothetical protein